METLWNKHYSHPMDKQMGCSGLSNMHKMAGMYLKKFLFQVNM
jgi:hypothetical protein